MRIIPRNEWKARYGDGIGWTSLPVRELWLHHSVTIAPDLIPPFSDDDQAIQTIDRIGAERFGWNYGFPYTFGVTPVGRIYAGHNINKQGAHTGGRNSFARAICLVGNYERDDPPDAMLHAVAWLVSHGFERGWWQHNRLTGGHRDVKATACPGIKAYRRIDDINRMAAEPRPMEDDMQFSDRFTDWAGNSQTFQSWMDNVDRRLYELSSDQPTVLESARTWLFGKAGVRNAGHGALTVAQMYERLESVEGKLDRLLAEKQ